MRRCFLSPGRAICALAAAVLASGCGQPLPAAAPTASAAPPKTAPAPAPALPAANLPADPVVRKLYEEIMAKNNAVQSYTCDWEGSERATVIEGARAGEVFELVHTESRAFKRPQLLHVRSAQVKHSALLWREGLVWETYVDGAFSWQYNHAGPPGSGQAAAGAFGGKLSDAQRAEIARRQETAHIFRANIAQLRAGGVWDTKIWPDRESLLSPFALCDLSTLALDTEDAETWTFSAKPATRAAENLRQLKVIIGKSDGILRELRGALAQTDGENVQKVSNLKLNPELPDATFQFTPPAGVEVTDSTEMELQHAK